jgi:hypothetical protein
MKQESSQGVSRKSEEWDMQVMRDAKVRWRKGTETGDFIDVAHVGPKRLCW